MALHTKWSSGHLIFHDGTNDILEIKNGTTAVSSKLTLSVADAGNAKKGEVILYIR